MIITRSEECEIRIKLFICPSRFEDRWLGLEVKPVVACEHEISSSLAFRTFCSLIPFTFEELGSERICVDGIGLSTSTTVTTVTSDGLNQLFVLFDRSHPASRFGKILGKTPNNGKTHSNYNC